MEALRMMAAEDAKARRKHFSVDAVTQAFPAAGGIFAGAVNMPVRVDDDDGEVFDPVLDDDTYTVTVSKAMPPASARCLSQVSFALHRGLVMRDRPYRRGGDSDDSGTAAALTAAEQSIAWRCTERLTQLCSPDAAHTAVDDNALAASMLRPWDRNDEAVAAVVALMQRVEAFTHPVVTHLPPLVAAAPVAAALGTVEALRFRLMRLLLDGDTAGFDATLGRASQSAARRCARRGIANDATDIDDRVVEAAGGAKPLRDLVDGLRGVAEATELDAAATAVKAAWGDAVVSRLIAAEYTVSVAECIAQGKM